MTRRLIPALMCLSLALAACGSGPSAQEKADAANSVWSKYANMTPAERDPELAKIAKDEGGLVYYAGWTYADKHGEAFEKKYGIKAQVFHADNETIEQRVRQERDARKTQVDVLEADYLLAPVLDNEGFFFRDWKPDTNGIEQDGPGWFAIRNLAYVVGWNTKLVKPGEEPKSFQDLADPKWKGKIGLEVGDVHWYVGLVKYFTSQGMSQQQITDLMMKIAANSRQAKGHTAMATALANGEYAILASAYNQSIDLIAQKGGPAAWKTASGTAVQPLILYPTGIGLAKESRHPASAMLFADFLASDEGQKIYADNAAVPIEKTLSPVAKYQTVSTAPAPPELLEGKKFQDEYQEILDHTGK